MHNALQSLLNTMATCQHSASMLVVMAQASAAAAPTYKLLEYKYVPDILEKRGPYRADHLAGAQKKVGASKAHVLAHSALQAVG